MRNDFVLTAQEASLTPKQAQRQYIQKLLDSAQSSVSYHEEQLATEKENAIFFQAWLNQIDAEIANQTAKVPK